MKKPSKSVKKLAAKKPTGKPVKPKALTKLGSFGKTAKGSVPKKGKTKFIAP